MTAYDLIKRIEGECRRLGVSPDSIEVQLDDEPSRPVLAVGHAKRFDGYLTIEITANEYPVAAAPASRTEETPRVLMCACGHPLRAHADRYGCIWCRCGHAADCNCAGCEDARRASPGNDGKGAGLSGGAEGKGDAKP